MSIKKEISLVIGILALTAIYIVGALKLAPPIDDGEYTSSFYPWLLIFMMLTACIYQIISLKKQLKFSQKSSEKKIFNMPVTLGILTLAVFVFAFNYIGFWTASGMLTFGIASIFEVTTENKKEKWAYIIILTILTPIIGYLFYGTLFNVHFPEGILF